MCLRSIREETTHFSMISLCSNMLYAACRYISAHEYSYAPQTPSSSLVYCVCFTKSARRRPVSHQGATSRS
uniref:Uncharacterized protein n=1 Tax=viral metagenome TaxID=1070528 RepID=A0A6C0C168_9ZZZZ